MRYRRFEFRSNSRYVSLKIEFSRHTIVVLRLITLVLQFCSAAVTSSYLLSTK